MKKRTALLLLIVLPLISISLAQAQPNDYTDNKLNEFNPSLVVIIVILVAALFLMGFFSIYIRNCADSPPNSVTPLTGARARRAARGLDPAVIQTFPILQYSEVKIHKIGKEALECAVCLCEFEETETLRLIPKCDHVFHPDCIDQWLSSHTSCPVCRANLAPTTDVDEANADAPAVAARDLEAQNDVVEAASEQHNGDGEGVLAQAEVVLIEKMLNGNRRRSKRGRRFARSQSSGENMERFTLRLPVEVRKQVINRELQRASSLIVLARESSSRQGGEGSSRGKSLKSERWILSMARALSIRSPRLRNNDVATTSSSSTSPILPPDAVHSTSLPL
ncbi:hypothetical protein VNO78_18393 [Psophocarpus tetragonolobus]|uniref:RING-type E3 ubiquitin transferase n=1 Tax=Psophocarpus tetragonolobus TaxID=3891 RepID=A0AAN9XM53_PSOTE